MKKLKKFYVYALDFEAQGGAIYEIEINAENGDDALDLFLEECDISNSQYIFCTEKRGLKKIKLTR